MDAYESLRQQARQKRDAIIRAARIEFRQTVRRIGIIERQIGEVQKAERPRDGKPQPMVDLLCDVIPRDRTFTVAEAIDLMREAEPGRSFNVPSIRTQFQRLEDQGMIRRVRRTQGAVLWAAAGYNVPDTPYGAKQLPEVAADVLCELGPLTATELLVAIRERGYRTDADPHKLLNSLTFALKRRTDTFSRGGDGKWRVVE